MIRLPALALITLPSAALAGIIFGNPEPEELRPAHLDPDDAGLIIFGNPEPESLRPGCDLEGQLSGARWWGDGGDQLVGGPPRALQRTLSLRAPAGTWTDVELLLSGPVQVYQDETLVAELELESLWVALDEPVEHAGGALRIQLRLAGACEDEEAITAALQAGIEGSVR